MVARAVRHDAHRLNLAGNNARLFLALAPQRALNALTLALMHARQAIEAVHKTRLRPLQHKHLGAAANERVDDNRKRSSRHAAYLMATLPNLANLVWCRADVVPASLDNKPMENPAPAPQLALKRRVEEASLNAWPAMQQVLLDGWLLRFSKGFTKRANCVVPLYPSLNRGADSDALEAKLRYCENLYGREQLQTIFRLTSLQAEHGHAHLDGLLQARGYSRTEQTLVLTRPLDKHPVQEVPGRCELLDLEQWVTVYGQLTAMPKAAVALHKAILQGIQARCAFAALTSGEGWVACGLAVLEQDLLGLFDIVTHPGERRRGHGRSLVTALLDWGRNHEAQQAYLQVVADNTAAADLYQQLDFENLYNYWYRVSG